MKTKKIIAYILAIVIRVKKKKLRLIICTW